VGLISGIHSAARLIPLLTAEAATVLSSVSDDSF
jgi:hypothetical protein